MFLLLKLRKDVLVREGMQRRLTRLIPGLAGLTYDVRLSGLGLYLPEFRRMRGEPHRNYKILTGLDKVHSEGMVGDSRTRGHSLRIRDRPFGREMWRNVFTQRVGSLWNSLPRKVVEAKILNVFKKQLDVAL